MQNLWYIPSLSEHIKSGDSSVPAELGTWYSGVLIFMPCSVIISKYPFPTATIGGTFFAACPILNGVIEI